MKFNLHKTMDIGDLIAHITAHLARHDDEVTATLRAAANGDLPMPETFEPEEKADIQAVFAWMAEVGAAKAFAELVPTLVAENVVIPLWESAIATGRGGFAAIARRLPRSLPGGPLGHTPDFRGLDKHHLSRFVVLLVSYILYDDFHHPQPEKGVYNIAGDLFEKLKWVYRYRFNQLETAQQASGLEELFASQDLHFPEDEAGPKKKISVTCAGDLLAVDVLVPENTPQLFDGIADFYTTADIVSANLESTVDKSSPVGRTQAPGEAARMNTSEAMFQKFRDEGKINFFSTATNHSLDWGEPGVLATLDVLRESGADYAGTASSTAEQDDVVVVEKNGIKVGLLTFTFDLNGHPCPEDKPYLVNEVRFNDADPAPDYSLVGKHVAAAKAKGADYIIAYCHWGWEFEMYPHPNVVDAAHTIISLGVDTILGNHPHVSQPMQRVVRDGKPDGLIVFAFGDFVSYHPESRNSKLAYSVRFDIVQDETRTGTRTYLANLKMLPIYLVNAKRDDGSFDCRIVRFSDVCADPDGYGLTPREKSELAHLRDEVLHGILLPREGKSILA